MNATTRSSRTDPGRAVKRWLLTVLLAALGLTGLAGRTEAASANEAADRPAASAPAAARTCDERRQRSRGRGRLIGGALGGAAGLLGGGRGGRAVLATALVPTGALLGDVIAGLLDCDERQKAAAATETALDGGVGTTTSWASTTRPGVSGSSTVIAAAASADGGDCMTVTDVVIVDGEETRAPKHMCRRPPANRYARV